jgi:hypothetical protein
MFAEKTIDNSPVGKYVEMFASAAARESDSPRLSKEIVAIALP